MIISTPIIEVRALSKKYRLGELGVRTLREEIYRGWERWRNGIPAGLKSTPDRNEFWALRDISFEVQPGEVLGIIGRNGAGKSTLLKILSRITEPTSGEAILRGRVVSLLEVGTGFNPELTGRENIFLNGTILGMKKREIAGKLDEIVAFAEVEKFLDTPVKRYSSGMYVRLAFAVAAHLEPEILIIDEVLAVGDAQFQKKCLGKMQDVAGHGRTVLFVSHNLTSVQSLCSQSVLLERGRVSCVGNTEQVLTGYLRQQKAQAVNLDKMTSDHGRLGDGRVRFTQLELTDKSGRQISKVSFGADFFIRGQIANKLGGKGEMSVAFAIARSGGEIIFTSHHDDEKASQGFNFDTLAWKASLTPNVLKPGLYSLYVGITDENWNCIDYIPDCMTFEILPLVESETSSRLDKRPGVIMPPKVAWEIVKI